MMFDAKTIMRTTLTIDDDVLSAAREMAAAQDKTVGEVISLLARQGLNPVASRRTTRNGVPLLPVRKGSVRVTSELIHQLREELRELQVHRTKKLSDPHFPLAAVRRCA
jgi:hypothetical protein